ncbi:MAG: IclR family transcriptional regulator [Haloarculaceae archaeon]
MASGSAPDGTDERNGIQTTATSLDVVEAVRELDGARTVEVAAELDVAKSTAHKHLQTLLQRGYLTRVAGEYRIGLKFLDLGEDARRRWPCLSTVREAVTDLADGTDEDVDFCVAENDRVYTLVESYHKWEKYHEAQAGYRVNLGDSYYMHSVASGKAILATCPESTVRAVADRWGLPAVTENTITDVDELLAELEGVRERGYALSDEEYVLGLRTVSRTVSLPEGQVLGALSVSGPAYRMTGAVLHDEIDAVLRETAEALEARIADGYPDKFFGTGAVTPMQDARTSAHSDR